jgi:hypothetical protein
MYKTGKLAGIVTAAVLAGAGILAMLLMLIQGPLNGLVNFFLAVAYIAFFICPLLILLFIVREAKSNIKGLYKPLIGLGVLAVIFLFSYLAASSAYNMQGKSPEMVAILKQIPGYVFRLSEAGLYTFY